MKFFKYLCSSIYFFKYMYSSNQILFLFRIFLIDWDQTKKKWSHQQLLEYPQGIHWISLCKNPLEVKHFDYLRANDLSIYFYLFIYLFIYFYLWYWIFILQMNNQKKIVCQSNKFNYTRTLYWKSKQWRTASVFSSSYM